MPRPTPFSLCCIHMQIFRIQFWIHEICLSFQPTPFLYYHRMEEDQYIQCFLVVGFFFSISCFSGSIKMCQWMINPRHSLLQCQWDLLTESLHCHSHIRTIFRILIYPTCPNQGQDFWMKCDRESFAGLFSVRETSQRQKSWSCYIRSFQVMLLLFFNELLPANTCCTF